MMTRPGDVIRSPNYIIGLVQDSEPRASLHNSFHLASFPSLVALLLSLSLASLKKDLFQ